MTYQRSWSGGLADAVAASRGDDLRRGITLVGPHRDEAVLAIGGLPARTHASQGEQRSLALALRSEPEQLRGPRAPHYRAAPSGSQPEQNR